MRRESAIRQCDATMRCDRNAAIGMRCADVKNELPVEGDGGGRTTKSGTSCQPDYSGSPPPIPLGDVMAIARAEAPCVQPVRDLVHLPIHDGSSAILVLDDNWVILVIISDDDPEWGPWGWIPVESLHDEFSDVRTFFFLLPSRFFSIGLGRDTPATSWRGKFDWVLHQRFVSLWSGATATASFDLRIGFGFRDADELLSLVVKHVHTPWRDPLVVIVVVLKRENISENLRARLGRGSPCRGIRSRALIASLDRNRIDDLVICEGERDDFRPLLSPCRH